jgi:hypothetical protein
MDLRGHAQTGQETDCGQGSKKKKACYVAKIKAQIPRKNSGCFKF